MTMEIETVRIPEGTGRITASSPIWEQLINARINGMAIRLHPKDYVAAKRIVNTLARRVRKSLPSSKLHSLWNKEESTLTLWISD